MNQLVHVSLFDLLKRSLSPYSYLCFCTLLLLNACIERTPKPDFIITRVVPEALIPGESLRVYGQGFGQEQGHVAISARPLFVREWQANEVAVDLPLETPLGERFLVVSRSDGTQSPPYPIQVIGERSMNDAQPLSQDMGLVDMTQVDQALEADMVLMPDMSLGTPLNVQLDEPNATVVMEAEFREFNGSQEIWLSIIARNPQMLEPSSPDQAWSQTGLWGAAAHLNYPTDRLEFIRMRAESGADAAALRGDISGRVHWYFGNLTVDEASNRTNLITLRFKQLDPNDLSPIRFEIPPRFASLRGRHNQRLLATWSAGTLLLEERP